MGIFEILLLLAIALIVIPPDDLPQVLRAAGKVMRELRLASNTVMRELSSAIGDEPPYNLLPPRFDDELPPPPASAASAESVTDLASVGPQTDTTQAAPAAPVVSPPAEVAASLAPATAAEAHPASAEPSAHAADTKP